MKPNITTGASQKRDGACRQFRRRAGVPTADGEAAGSSSTGILPVDGAKRRPMPDPTRASRPRYSRNAGKMPALQRFACPVFEMRPITTTITITIPTVTRRLLASSLLAASLFASLLFLAAPPALCASATLEHPFVGTYKREAAQGMTIYKDTAFLFHNTGICRVYNLKTGAFINAFELDTAAPENHSNCADFGVEFPAGNHSYPAIYISECYGKQRCFVENINELGAKLIQTLSLKTGGREDRPFDWFVDRDNKFLYAITIIANKDGMKDYLLTKLPLPALADGDVAFAKKDIIDQFTIQFSNLSQGGTIRGDRLYLPVGSAKPAPPRKDPGDRAVLIVNLKTKQIEKTLDLNDHISIEPEDAAFHNDNLLMYCGQSGGLWRIDGL